MVSAQLRTPVEINYALGRRCIRASGVARQSNTAEYSPSSRLAGTALRHPRCCTVYFDRGPKHLHCNATVNGQSCALFRGETNNCRVTDLHQRTLHVGEHRQIQFSHDVPAFVIGVGDRAAQ